MHLLRSRRTAAAVLALCLAPTLSACGGGGTQSAGGNVVPAREDTQFSKDKQVVIATPIGEIDIHAGKPITQIPAKDTRELTAQNAPAGMAYLPITWQFDKSTTKTYAQYVETTAVPTVDLHSGDATYRLPSPDPAQGADSFYVLIQTSSSHPSLAVGFDGVTQTADLVTGKRKVGRAAGLYDLAHKTLRPSDCPGPTWKRVLARSTETCKLTGPLRLPYAAGKWAPAGHDWIVLNLETSLTTFTEAGDAIGSGGIYYAEGVKTTYTLGRKKPVAVIGADNLTAVCPEPSSGSCNANAALVFAAKGAAHTLNVKQEFTMLLTHGWSGYAGKKHEKVVGETTIPLHIPR